jgi:hypothetical protein
MGRKDLDLKEVPINMFFFMKFKMKNDPKERLLRFLIARFPKID